MSKINKVKLGQIGIYDPKTRKITWRTMTPKEDQEARDRLEKIYNPDMTRKGFKLTSPEPKIEKGKQTL